MAKLTYKERKGLSKSQFAIPGKAPESGSFPIPDESHARNALARVSQFGSSSEKATVRAKVHKKFPGIEMESRASGGRVFPSNPFKKVSDVLGTPPTEAKPTVPVPPPPQAKPNQTIKSGERAAPYTGPRPWLKPRSSGGCVHPASKMTSMTKKSIHGSETYSPAEIEKGYRSLGPASDPRAVKQKG